MSHSPKYLNSVTVGPAICVWPHLFQARQFQGKGDPRFDCSIVINPDQLKAILPKVQGLAQEAFPAGEAQLPAFAWPFTPTEQKLKSPKLGEMFPGHFLISAKAYEENPPRVLIPNTPGHAPKYIDMPETQRSTLVYDGAHCMVGLDFASYYTGSNFGIRVQLGFILFWNAGDHISIGSRPDAASQLESEGIDIQMQAPSGIEQQTAPQAGQTPVPQGLPDVPMGNQPMPGPTSQQQAPQQQVGNLFAPQQAPQQEQVGNPFAPPPVNFNQ